MCMTSVLFNTTVVMAELMHVILIIPFIVFVLHIVGISI